MSAGPKRHHVMGPSLLACRIGRSSQRLRQWGRDARAMERWVLTMYAPAPQPRATLTSNRQSPMLHPCRSSGSRPLEEFRFD